VPQWDGVGEGVAEYITHKKFPSVGTFVQTARLSPSVGVLASQASAPTLETRVVTVVEEGAPGVSPGAFVTVSASQDLVDGQPLLISGRGFLPNSGLGLAIQCVVDPLDDYLTHCAPTGVPFSTDELGNIRPVELAVSPTFEVPGTDGPRTVSCDEAPCYILIHSEEPRSISPGRPAGRHALHPISFGDGQEPTGEPGLPSAAAGDYDGDGATDKAVFRPATSQFFVRGGDPEVTQYGQEGDVPVPADYNGDGVVDKAVYRRSTGQWFIRNAPPIPEVVVYGDPCASPCGAAGDLPVPADYDGDGDADIAVFRPTTGQWFVQGGSPEVIPWGAVCALPCAALLDIPVPGDYDADGRADKAVYRTTTGQWFVQGGPVVAYGDPDDLPAPRDYDGDGAFDFAVFRPSTGVWFVRGGLPEATQYGFTGPCCADVPVAADYDGDGVTEKAVYRRSTGQWFVRNGTPEVTQYGGPDDIPMILPYPIRLAVGLSS